MILFIYVLGDGNMHLNITAAEFNPKLLHTMEPKIFEFVSSVRGSISAEHGIGFLKPKFLHYSKSANEITLMKEIKSLLDPKGILNPLKVLDWTIGAVN